MRSWAHALLGKDRPLTPLTLLLRDLGALLAQSRPCFLRQMRDCPLLPGSGGGFRDVTPRGRDLFCGCHKKLMFA